MSAPLGRVAIVGGGPGAADLVTVRGRALLEQADVVLIDHLAPQEVRGWLRPDAAVVDVGKYPHGTGPTRSQDAINALLVEHALAGRNVVRLKGGDPFVLGRGGEEAIACRAAGVPCEIVPGVTSAVAVPALAGIPVTHRGLAQQVTIVSGHVPPGDPSSDVDWALLGAGPGTVVVLMGITHLAAIRDALVAGGRPPSTPAAVLCHGCTAEASTLVTTLASLAEDAVAAGVGTPGIIVVGDVVSVRELLV